MTGAVLKVAAVLAAGCGFVICALAGGAPALASDSPSPTATSSIPADLLVLFEQAAKASPCGVPWTLLAAVAHTESDFDEEAVSAAGAEGMFQFEPATFAAYDRPTPPGGAVPPSPFDPADAAFAAGRYLCSLGITHNPTLALVAYNCGNTSAACQIASDGYATQVLAVAASFTATNPAAENPTQATALAYAESQIGTPYVYGGADATSGFDCSGLVVWAYGLAGIAMPRTAEDQWQAEPHVPMEALVPGDLIFFGNSGQAQHVGIYMGDQAMIDAPHTGATVRVETIPLVVGAAWGDEAVLGAADPVAP